MGQRFDDKEIKAYTEWYCYGSFAEYFQALMPAVVDYVLKEQLETPLVFEGGKVPVHHGRGKFHEMGRVISEAFGCSEGDAQFYLRQVIGEFTKKNYPGVYEQMKYEVEGGKMSGKLIWHVSEALLDGKIFELIDRAKADYSVIDENDYLNLNHTAEHLRRGEVDRIIALNREDEARDVILRVREAVKRGNVGEEVYKRIEGGANEFMQYFGIGSLQELAEKGVMGSTIV